MKALMMKYLLLAAIGIAWSGSAVAQDKVIFSLNWIPAGNHYGVFAAKEQGFYKEANLDVDIQRGYGSGDTVKRIATGAAHMGIADATSVIVGRGNGLNVKQVAILFGRSADAIFFIEGNKIAQPKDLEGRTLGGTTGETTLNLVPIFAKNAGIDASKIQIVNLTSSAKFSSLAGKSIDSIVGFVNEEPAIKAAAGNVGLKVGRFTFADYGIDYYSIGLIASDDLIQKNPDLVRRLATATMKGYAWALKNREAAADAFVKALPENNRAVSLAQWDVARQLITTDSALKNGLGWIEEGKMNQTIALIRNFQKVDGALTAKDVYTMSFIPKIKID
ncbi:MAG: ABC transporter substrate-binding protein [Thermomicrobiales bacterium]